MILNKCKLTSLVKKDIIFYRAVEFNLCGEKNITCSKWYVCVE